MVSIKFFGFYDVYIDIASTFKPNISIFTYYDKCILQITITMDILTDK